VIEYSDRFLQEAKRLSKKYQRLKHDLKEAVATIEEAGELGTPLGHGLYKKRIPNSSIPTGKRGGFRIIIYTKLSDRIVLLSIYAKSHKESLSDEELKALIEGLA
jgi:hypothetical protein